MRRWIGRRRHFGNAGTQVTRLWFCHHDDLAKRETIVSCRSLVFIPGVRLRRTVSWAPSGVS